MQRIFVIGIVALAFFSTDGELLKTTHAQESVVQDPFVALRTDSFDRLIEVAGTTSRVRVIVGLRSLFVPEGNLSASQIQKQRREIKNSQRDFLGRYQDFDLSNIKRFDLIPYIAFEADGAMLTKLKADDLVVNIQEDVASAPGLAESTPIVGAPEAWAAGYSGAGQTVAIVDSGVDKNHTFLAGKVISEACYSSNNASSTSFCPGGATESTASNSGLNCPSNVAGCTHGTHVAGIAAGRGTTFSGVAKDANIIAIQIFSRFSSTNDCGSSTPCALYWTTDLIRGLERVKVLSDTMNNIAAVNLSLQTGQQFVSNCDLAHAATKAAIDNLRSVGIPTTVCAGNFAFTNALTAPACISTSVSVGSVDDGSLGTTMDFVSEFSDSSPLLHLLAPGRWINSSIPGNSFSNFSGTSMATPHVVGAFAILRQRKPSATISEMLDALITTGQPILDTRNGIIKPRIRIAAALQSFNVAPARADFDADGKSDLSVYRASDSNWYVFNSSGGTIVRNWGLPTDVLTPGDFDGDGKADAAAYRPSTGQWYVLRSSDSSVNILTFGVSGDIPAAGDYDGDGKADEAVFRPSTGVWYVYRSSDGGVSITAWGASGDVPVASDYDGDGKYDVGVFRPSNGVWYVYRTTAGPLVATWGVSTDKPVQADYDGDGKTDLAIYRPSEGNWYVYRSTDNSIGITNWGNATDTTAPGDFDGDGKYDFSVFRSGTWYIYESTAGPVVATWGIAGDVPIPAKYIP